MKIINMVVILDWMSEEEVFMDMFNCFDIDFIGELIVE